MPLSLKGSKLDFHHFSLSLFFFFLYIAMLICSYLKAGCGLEFFAELDFLLVWPLNGEELYAVLPERKPIYLLIQHLECSGFLYKEKEIVYVLYIDGDVVDGSIFHLCLVVLIGLDDEIVELEEGYFLGAVYCAEGSLEAQGMIKLNGLVDVVGRNADVLHACCKIFNLHNDFLNEFVFR